MPFRVVSPARRDLVRDAVWYEGRQFGLGDRFLDAVKRAFQRIADNPESHPKEESTRWRRNIRRCPVEGFPYQVIYEIRADDLSVLAIAHGKRRPKYWSRRK